MASFEDPYKVLRHVRKAFIEHDETGMCAEIAGDRLPDRKILFPSLADTYDSEEEERSSSQDDCSDWDFEKSDQKKMKYRGVIDENEEETDSEDDILREGGSPSTPVVEEEPEIMFERKEINKNRRTGRSLLTYQLEQRIQRGNPFSDYARFEGNYEIRGVTKKFKIFLTMLGPSERDYPLTVCVLSSAKVSDLIGLICFKYTAEHQNKNVRFKEDVNEYGLFIADERGEVDWEFPSLDPFVQIGKFSLQYLALVELSDSNIPREAIVERVPASPEQETIEDQLQREAEWEALERFMEDLKTMSALVLETFPVKMIYKKRKKVRVLLAISLDVFTVNIEPEAYPHQSHHPKGVQLPINLESREIVACEPLKRKSRDRATFRVWNHAEDDSNSVIYQSNDFECNADTVEKIIDKLNSIMEIRGSSLRQDYLDYLLKKKTTNTRRKRRIFNFWCH